jgi:glycerophosphoryl diester phosphodiesterase
MKIIGHRGAAGLAPENTVKAIEAGIKAGADAVEFDVRRTKDGVFILSHATSLERIAGNKNLIKDLDFSEIRAVRTFNDEPIATLDEALHARGTTMAVIEAKGKGWAEDLVVALKKHLPSLHVCVISFNHSELAAFHELLPDVPCYALEYKNAIHAINFAAKHGLVGVDLNFWILNPFTYLYAHIRGLDILMFTVNQPFAMRIFSKLYPSAAITTNRPDILKKIKK